MAGKGNFIELSNTNGDFIMSPQSPPLLSFYVRDGKLHADYDPANLSNAANALVEEVMAIQARSITKQ